MSDKRDVSGVWYGRYRSASDAQNNSFIALLSEQGGAITGSISEPEDDRRGGSGGVRHAEVQGQRTGSRLSFTKQYDGSGGFTHAVFYSGQIDSEGTVIDGAWQVDWVHGSFAMQREKFDEAELEDEEEIELTVR